MKQRYNSNKMILVTGSSGTIGNRLCENLEKYGIDYPQPFMSSPFDYSKKREEKFFQWWLENVSNKETENSERNKYFPSSV